MSYRRAAGSVRGRERREALLQRVVEDLAANGLVGFSLRRAARAAGTTHKVLLYHFDDVDLLLQEAITRLRDRRVHNAREQLGALLDGRSLADRVQVIWNMLVDDVLGLRVLDQAIGLSLYDSSRYGAIAREASEQYLPILLSICPDGWTDERKVATAHLVLAALRGFLIEWLTTGDMAGPRSGMEALARALDRESAGDVRSTGGVTSPPGTR